MAKVLLTPKKVGSAEVAVHEIRGLSTEDIRELAAIGIRNLEELVEALLETNWIISARNDKSKNVYFSALQVKRIAECVAARPDTPNMPEPEPEGPVATLYDVPVEHISGIPSDLFPRLHVLGLGSLGAILDGLDSWSGALWLLNNKHTAISQEESDLVGDMALYDKRTPAEIREKFVPSTFRRVQVQSKPAPAPQAQPNPVPAVIKVEVPEEKKPAPQPQPKTAPAVIKVEVPEEKKSAPQAQPKPAPAVVTVVKPEEKKPAVAPKQESIPHAAAAGVLQLFGIKL